MAKNGVAQVRAVADALATSPVPLDADALAGRFSARTPWKKRLPQLLDVLVALRRAREQDGRYTSQYPRFRGTRITRNAPRLVGRAQPAALAET